MDLFLKNAGWNDIEVCLDEYQEKFVVDASRLLTLVMGEGGVTPPCTTKPMTCPPSED